MVAGELLNRYRIITAYALPNNPNVIQLEPPLIVTKEHIDKVLEALDDIFTRNRGVFHMMLTSTKTVVTACLAKGKLDPLDNCSAK